jgi:Amt family ammonium transporter
MGGLWIGFTAGILCFFGATWLKRVIGYDDSLDAFGVHGIGGIVGAILTGVFAVEAVGGTRGMLEGNIMQVWTQIEGILATLAYSAIGTLVILMVVKAVMGLRVSRETEIEGLDINLHGEVVH